MEHHILAEAHHIGTVGEVGHSCIEAVVRESIRIVVVGCKEGHEQSNLFEHDRTD